MADDPAKLSADNNMRGYIDEARMIMSVALRDRLPATAEAFGEHDEALNINEMQVTLALAQLLVVQDTLG